jgi:uncharacterized protein YidB (DUF937 family)
MDDLLKKLQGQGGQAGGAAGAGLGGGVSGLLGGGAGAMLPTLMPAVLGMLGSGGKGQTGMHELLATMQSKGFGDVAKSWIGPGPSQPITPSQAEQVLGPDKVQQLAAKSGLPVDQVRQGLSAILPGLVDHLTPNGQVPAPTEVQSAISGLLGGLGR